MKILSKRARAPKKLVTQASQTFTFSRRAFFLGSAQLAVGGLLIGRMGWIAIAENEKYRLGVKILELGNVISSNMNIRQTMLPYMQELADYSGDDPLGLWYRFVTSLI